MHSPSIHHGTDVMNKIQSIEEVAKAVATYKAMGKKIVHCHGCFDLLHIGHLRHFQQARQLGDVLVVTVTPDRFVDKGSNHPAFPEGLRVEALSALSCVDLVAINPWPTAEETLRLLKPDFYVKGVEFRQTGEDYTGKMGMEAAVVKEVGAQLHFTGDIVFSSTNLINRYLSKFSDEVNKYLRLFRGRYRIDDLFAVLDRMESLSVLVVGDAILDDYHYVNAIGKSSKDPILALKHLSSDMFAGGAVAIANQVAQFASRVELLTVLGARESHEAFLRDSLSENVTPRFHIHPDAPTLTKRRYLEGYALTKLFEVYIEGDTPLPRSVEQEMRHWLTENLGRFDLVIVADYGHGAITDGLVKTLVDSDAFLAVNTQANAGNRGYHTVSRYRRADYVCLAEPEVRLECRSLHDEIHPLLDQVARRLACGKMAVTRGKRGSIMRDVHGNTVEVPAFVFNAVDRVGAGDAFLSVTAPAARLNAPEELIGFIGNVLGSLAVEIIGNKHVVKKLTLKKHITSILK
ncbi:MAG: adenylyltransferase/cytidyltransferase family protein [Magnetococcales bacterium]|nr:adenylyltransferase/cytidyltransferase family protein [Magnetococcales bacterium]